MHSKFLKTPPPFPLTSQHAHQAFPKFISYVKNSSSSSSSSSSSENKNGFKILGKSLGDYKTRLNDLNGNLMQDKINIWVSKTTSFLNELTSPLVKNVQDKNPPIGNSYETDDVEDVFMTEHTIDTRTPSGDLSLVAIISIEQFSRMNGLTGKKMQMTFKGLVPESVSSNAHNLVEYCCFKFLCRDTSEIHPSLKELAFQRLIFATMLAWEHPYSNNKDDKVSFQRKLVGEEAFVRIAPSVSGIADWPTAHNLFKALSGSQKGISFRMWSTYVNELLKVYERRKSYLLEEIPDIGDERILCLGSGSKRPVLKWENNMAWPGKLTLTDKALYFEEIGLRGKRDAIRMDLTCHGSRVEKAKVGPFGSDLFDSAVSITSGSESKSWILEFVDFGGEMRRDVWYAFIKEVISVHKFIQDFGPKENDQSLHNVYGAKKGKTRATNYAINGIARLQALQIIKKLLDEPTKLVQFSYLQNAPYGEIVLQTLAVNLWGGPLTTDSNKPFQGMMTSSSEVSEVYSNHVYDIDGSVYLRRWMKHPSWNSSVSIAFWKNASVKQALVLSKSHVVEDKNLVEKAMITCRDKYQVVESTQATIDAAMIEGIPSNIDLFKELLLPLTMAAKSFEKLRRWEEPYLTASFLGFTYTLIFRNLLGYVFPTTLMVLASCMLVVKGLKEQGRLGRSFGKVTICDQPPSNTIEKIIAVKEAMRDVEKYMQTLNVSLLKIRTILLAGQPKITTEVAVVLFFGSAILLIIPFKYILAFVTFDFFTRELEFRKETVRRFNRLLKERWDTVPATPVSVLPFMSSNDAADVIDDKKKERNNLLNSERTRKTQ